MNDKHSNPNFYQQDFGATTPNVRFDPDSRAPQQQPPPSYQQPPQMPPPRPPQQQSAPRRGVPGWVWGLVGALVLLLLGGLAVAIYFVTREAGFTLIVSGAPPNSDVFIDNVRRGVTSADGTIKVSNLKAGKRIVKVTHRGFKDFNTSATGKDGETKTITAQPESLDAAPPKNDELASQIEYNGTMMLVGAGEYTMGSDSFAAEEKPAHKVTLPDFYIDKFEVTNAQYKKFCAETGRPLPTNPWWDPQYLNNDAMPVVGVSWDDATAYARWAGKRLPTEQEWEKAASWDSKGSVKRKWPWGDTGEGGRANIGTEHPTPGGQFPGAASAYGVQDMAGNVLEWVADNYGAYPGNTAANPNFGTKYKVVRGGHFKSPIDAARTTARIYAAPQFTAAEKRERSWLIGLRTAVSADDPKLKEFLERAGGAQ